MGAKLRAFLKTDAALASIGALITVHSLYDLVGRSVTGLIIGVAILALAIVR